MAIVVEQRLGFKPPVRPQRCRLQSYTHLDYFMLEHNPFDLAHSLGQAVGIASFHRSFSTPCLTLAPKVEEEPNLSPKIEIAGGRGDHKVRALVLEAAMTLVSGVDPVPLSSGLGGTYLLSGRKGEKIAVAKPIDEEPLACNNPKGFTGRLLGQPGLKRSVKVGESGVREVAAYLLDHGQFAGVPPTALVNICHVSFNLSNTQLVSTPPPSKIASLQRFVEHDCDAGDLGPTSFSVSCVHRIGILDVRLLNIDRHSGNILVRKHEHESINCTISGGAELVPIDHGLCLPEWIDDPYFEWLHWPQASIPFSEAELEYISNLDPFADVELLRSELSGLLSESSLRVLVVCSIFLKQAAKAGLCLSDIGEMMTRECHRGEETMSVLELICTMAKDCILKPSNCNDTDDLINDEIVEEDHEEEDDFGVFQLDEDCDGTSNKKVTDAVPYSHQKLPFLAKPPLIPRFVPENTKITLMSPYTEEGVTSDEIRKREKKIKNRDMNSHMVGCLTRSVSLGVPNLNIEAGGVSFEDLSEEEWVSFLQAFEKLLPNFLEGQMGIASVQRLGTSCRF